MELYYREDYSLGEIASESNVSRQAVYDNIKRTEQLLHTYEEKLSLYDKFLRRQGLIEQLKEEIGEKEFSEEIIALIEQIQKID